MPKTLTRMDYDQDFFEWTAETARLLREGHLDAIDIEHIAEEIEDLGNRVEREVLSRLEVLIVHLLKWRFQPERRSPSWSATIDEQRRELNLIFESSPSLKRKAISGLAAVEKRAARAAARQTGLTGLPEPYPWNFDSLLDTDFFPG